MDIEDFRQLHIVGNAVAELTTAASKLPTNPDIERAHTKLASLCHEVAEAMVATQRRSAVCGEVDEGALARAAVASLYDATVAAGVPDPKNGPKS